MKKVFLALALFTYAGSMATSTYAAVTGTEVVKKDDDKRKKKKKRKKRKNLLNYFVKFKEKNM